MKKVKSKKVKLDKVPLKKLDKMAKDIGTEVREICDKAADEINEILNVYGLKVKLAIAFEHESGANLNVQTDPTKRA